MSFQDEFEGDELNSENWNYGFGWGMNSRSFEEKNSPDNVSVADGKLTIKFGQEEDNFVSGAINTKTADTPFAQRYGLFEARIKGTCTTGTINAFWSKSLDESWPPEIDFVEIWKGGMVANTIHFEDGKSGEETRDEGFGCSSFNTYATEWTETAVRWYINGEMVYEVTGDEIQKLNDNGQPFYMILNTHIAPNKHPWLGPFEGGGVMEVDWVRVWTGES